MPKNGQKLLLLTHRLRVVGCNTVHLKRYSPEENDIKEDQEEGNSSGTEEKLVNWINDLP